MALTGLQIQKLLPGTNCKECGSNTCLAFAMKLAAKKAEIKECPYASEEAVRTLGEATEPPVKKIRLGRDGRILLGDETVLYRHEKSFASPTAIAIAVDHTLPPGGFKDALSRIRDYRYERVGETFGIDMIAITQTGGEESFLAAVKDAAETCGIPLVLRSGSAAALDKAARMLKGNPSVIVSKDAAMAEALLPACKETGHALALSGSVDDLVSLTALLRERQYADIILNFDYPDLGNRFRINSIARGAAIRDTYKPLGFPFLSFLYGDPGETTVGAATEILKYGGVCILPSFDPAQLAVLFTLRLNIFTDPQKPVQVEPKLYPVGEPGKESPIFVTTNFSLTFFVVSAEIENSGVSSWLLVPDCDGMSVLTAWAAGKFNAAVIAKSVKEFGAGEKTANRKIVIPGYVAQISGELEEQLPGWEILVGPQEAVDIEGFVKKHFQR